ncbi:MAG: hypothetical protein ACRDST_18195 [Pseudonocardiaceae bacterium]
MNVAFAKGEAWRQLMQAACAPVGDPSRRIAIVLDDRIIFSPQVDPSVGCGGGVPADRRGGGARARCLRGDLLRRAHRPRGHPHPARPR